MATTGIVEEESRKRWTPVLEHAHQRAGLEVGRDVLLGRPSEAHAVDGGTDHELARRSWEC
jgi:hypothetical protein